MFSPLPQPPATGILDGELVALDLETTGLDPHGDRIIEIGATRFARTGAIESFHTLVNPGRPIPFEVQALTSITDADAAAAPPPALAVARLASFVGARPVIGHNVRFDLEFLAVHGFEPRAPVFDTWDLASVVLPRATRLSLGALCDLLQVPTAALHRALADAEAARDVFLRMLERLAALPRATLVDLAAIARSAQWEADALFEAALDAHRATAAVTEALTVGGAAAPATMQPPRPRTGAAVEGSDVEALFALAAARPDLLPGYEVRAGQREMARAVAAALRYGGQLAIEAGTGTGKSLAYLLPALLQASRSGERVVVSTHTINLQEQLLHRDIPAAAALVEAYEGLPPGEVRAAMLKGRANYLCLERWALRRHDPRPRTLAEARLHGRIAVWLPETQTGDVAELYMPSEERAAWAALSASDGDCLSRRCEYVRNGTCFLLRARQQAASAHLVVVNHALLLADAATEAGVLPAFEHVIVDEAHRLQDVATTQYGGSLSLRELRGLLEELAGPRGVGGRMETAASLDPAPLSHAAGLVPEAESLRLAARRARERVPALERALAAYTDERRETEPGSSEEDFALTSARYSQPLWEDVEERAVDLDVALHEVARCLERSRAVVQALPPGAAPGIEQLASDLGRAALALHAARGTLGDVALGGSGELVRWVHRGEADLRLNAAPLDVSGRLATDLFEARRSVVATSATLTAADSFEFSLGPLGLGEADTLQIASPYDYRRAVLVLVVNDVPEPDAPGHASALHDTLARATAAASGRTLALFTSHGAVRQAAAALRSLLAREGIAVLAQQVDGSPARLVESLLGDSRTLLLGTAAFWEGVDVRGEALSQLAVARLPFPVPTDPIHASRAAQYEDPFAEYALPQALLRFRQGFGRLIRGAEERGVFLVLDRRVLTRRYGEAFLEALPDCEIRRIPTSRVAEAVHEWLGR